MSTKKFEEKLVGCNVMLPEEIHREAKIAARLDNRSLKKYIVEAVKARNKEFMANDPASPSFVPPGLRK